MRKLPLNAPSPVDFGGEDVMGFEEASEDEEGKHDAGGP
jgi:hypothetical protein